MSIGLFAVRTNNKIKNFVQIDKSKYSLELLFLIRYSTNKITALSVLEKALHLKNSAIALACAVAVAVAKSLVKATPI